MAEAADFTPTFIVSRFADVCDMLVRGLVLDCDCGGGGGGGGGGGMFELH